MRLDSPRVEGPERQCSCALPDEIGHVQGGMAVDLCALPKEQVKTFRPWESGRSAVKGLITRHVGIWGHPV